MVARSPADYKIFKDFLEESCGIILGDDKQYLVASRLNSLMAENKIESLSELVQRMQQVSQRAFKQSVLDAMTTNETLWFRDTHPFAIFKDKMLPELQKKRNGTIKVWSAACSSGQEPYSLSMSVEEYRARNLSAFNYPVEIIGTDLSATMLEQCKNAEYDQLSLDRGLSDLRLKQFFEPISGQRWKVRQEVRARVRFKSLNLMDSFVALGKFDVIFCRNVLIYFSNELKADILKRIHGSLRPGGYLVLGASEGHTNVKDYYQMIQCNPGIIYQAI